MSAGACRVILPSLWCAVLELLQHLFPTYPDDERNSSDLMIGFGGGVGGGGHDLRSCVEAAAAGNLCLVRPLTEVPVRKYH